MFNLFLLIREFKSFTCKVVFDMEGFASDILLVVFCHFCSSFAVFLSLAVFFYILLIILYWYALTIFFFFCVSSIDTFCISMYGYLQTYINYPIVIIVCFKLITTQVQWHTTSHFNSLHLHLMLLLSQFAFNCIVYLLTYF